MKKLFISLFAFTFLIFIQFSFAFDNCIKIAGVEFEEFSDNKTIFTYQLANTTDSYLNDIYSIISLRKFSVEDNTYSEILKTYEPVKSSFRPQENKLVAHLLELPENLSEGQYAIYLEVNTRTYVVCPPVPIYTLHLDRDSQYTILPNGSYSKSFYWSVPNDALTGPSFNANTSPTATLNIISTLSNNITLTPQVTVYKRSIPFVEEPILITELNPITFKANEAKTIKLNLPKFSEAESYLAKIVFLDENSKQVSYEYYFRYVIKGESGKIIKIAPTYNTNTKMLDLSFHSSSSPDSSELKNAILEYSVVENGNVILTKKHELPTFKGENIITDNIPFKADTEFTIKAKLSKGSKIFDEYEITVPANINKTYTNRYFSDTINTSFYKSAKILAGLSYINGYPDSTFKPRNNITRAEMVVIASRLFDKKAIDTFTPTKTSFSDTSTHWANKYIEFASENNIVNGYPDGTFKPNNNVTYQEAITILLNTIGYKKYVATLSTTWPQNYIDTALRLKITPFYDDTTLASPAIRGDIANMTVKSLLRKGK